MSKTFKKAERKGVGLLIGFSGPSGSGKTYSALEAATGIVGEGQRFAVIDTENGRASHYADQFDFDHATLDPPFRPSAYLELAKAAAKEGYQALVIDSMSHAWAGEGGAADWHEEILQRMAGNDYKKRERVNMLAWAEPKQDHKRMVAGLLQLNMHLILCFRAEDKMKAVKNEKGKQELVHAGWLPITEKHTPYELTTHIVFDPERPGMWLNRLKVQAQHLDIFPEGQLVTREAGQKLAQWAAGGASSPASAEDPQSLKDEIQAAVDREDLDAIRKVWRRAKFADLREIMEYAERASEYVKAQEIPPTSPGDEEFLEGDAA
ncbi:MAG: AAA family ATPase [Myxococcota bacterium]